MTQQLPWQPQITRREFLRQNKVFEDAVRTLLLGLMGLQVLHIRGRREEVTGEEEKELRGRVIVVKSVWLGVLLIYLFILILFIVLHP
jgi:hypothetical protein